jgi:hypothetical protein
MSEIYSPVKKIRGIFISCDKSTFDEFSTLKIPLYNPFKRGIMWKKNSLPPKSTFNVN